MSLRTGSPSGNTDPGTAAPDVAAVAHPPVDVHGDVPAAEAPRSVVRADKTTRRPPQG